MILVIASEKDLFIEQLIDRFTRNGVALSRIRKNEIIGVSFSIDNTVNKQFTIETPDSVFASNELKGILFGRDCCNCFESFFESHNKQGYPQQQLCMIAAQLMNRFDFLPMFGKVLPQLKYDKLTMRQYAVECGLDIPAVLVTSYLEELKLFIAEHGSVTGCIFSDLWTANMKNDSLWRPHGEMREELLNSIPLKFSPSIFQQSVDHVRMVRVLYLMGSIYAFVEPNVNSQKPHNDDSVLPLEPGQLSEKLKSGIAQVMQMCHLSSGQLTFLVDGRGKFYLESIDTEMDQIRNFDTGGLDLYKVIAEKFTVSTEVQY